MGAARTPSAESKGAARLCDHALPLPIEELANSMAHVVANRAWAWGEGSSERAEVLLAFRSLKTVVGKPS